MIKGGCKMKKFTHIIRITLITVFVLITVPGISFPVLAASGEKVEIPAVPVLYNVSVNEQNYTLQAYEIDGQDYFKLRDIAFILKETIMRFDVDWYMRENAIYIETGEDYYAEGGELTVSNTMQTTSPVTSELYI